MHGQDQDVQASNIRREILYIKVILSMDLFIMSKIYLDVYAICKDMIK